MNQGDWMGIATLLAFLAICGIGVWTFSASRRARFEEAAQLPFADEPEQSPQRENDR
jgi:cytochrome c oxidase cbb3-type subunit 4